MVLAEGLQELAIGGEDERLVAVARLASHTVADHQMGPRLGGQRPQLVGMLHLRVEGQRAFVPDNEPCTLVGGLTRQGVELLQAIVGLILKAGWIAATRTWGVRPVP